MLVRPQRLLHDGLLVNAARLPAKPAVVVEGKPYTYGELLNQALRLATALQQRGLKRGDRVAIYMDNTWPCVVSIYAVLLAGGVMLVVNPQTKSDKLEFILDDCDAKILLTDGHLAGVFVPVLVRLKKLQTVICSGKLPDSSEINLEAFNDALEKSSPLSTPAPTIALDLAALIYTSGSTGNPKGVMQTHQSMSFAAGSLIEYLRLAETDRILCVLPLAFDYGLYQLLMAIQLGATLVLERSFTYPAQVFERMQANYVSVFPGVPTIFSMLLAAHARTPLSFPTVMRVTNTAAALPDDYVRKLREIFPNALIYKMYGLTECKRVCYLEPELIDAKPGSVGKAIPGTEVFLLSSDGQAVPPGETGILHVRGPHVMLGYWKRPDLSAQMLKEGKLPGERVLCTHDHFRMDSDGFLYFVGRSDDIIKTRGEKVSPVEVENVLFGIKGIREAAVIGIPDEVLGQAVCAYVVLETGAALTEKEIRAACLARLENFMVPKEIIIRSALPKTTTGKISKKALRQSESV
ncbi:MAG: acyl--CoA ligase [Gammaproteobacteria bacterium]|nr:acyl--CoA ligase [Gammaproteobacteria bacterium]